MASKARRAFDAHVEDIKQLLKIHKDIGGTEPGRRRLEVLNKSAIVLITAFWEAYCEDLAEEALDHLVANVPDASKLPKELRKRIGKEIKADPNDIGPWSLADAGWKGVVGARLAALTQKRNWDLNTPKTAQINNLFLEAVGLADVSSGWSWKGKTRKATEDALDTFVTLRGSIAHRGTASTSVKKGQVEDYFELVQHLTSKTGGRVNTFVKNATGKPLW